MNLFRNHRFQYFIIILLSFLIACGVAGMIYAMRTRTAYLTPIAACIATDQCIKNDGNSVDCLAKDYFGNPAAVYQRLQTCVWFQDAPAPPTPQPTPDSIYMPYFPYYTDTCNINFIPQYKPGTKVNDVVVNDYLSAASAYKAYPIWNYANNQVQSTVFIPLIITSSVVMGISCIALFAFLIWRHETKVSEAELMRVHPI